MLKLKIEKPLNYLSPSSLVTAMSSPNTFYLTRLVNNPLPKEPQGKAAAVGTAFDMLIKEKIWSEGISPSTFHLQPKLLKGIELKSFEKEAIHIGKQIMKTYIRTAYSSSNFKLIEIWKKFTFHAIPIYVKLDAAVLDHKTKELIPFDWKVSGFNPDNKSGMSPKPGYMLRYKGNEMCLCHKNYVLNMPMEQINMGWAIQTCTYGWSLGLSPKLDKSFPVRIDMITKTKKGLINVSLYRGSITPAFQEYVFNMYKSIWMDIQSGAYINRLISPYLKGLVFSAAQKETWY